MTPKRMPKLVGLTELALARKKSKQWIYQVLTTQAGAPKPVARLRAGPVYVESDALAFIDNRQPARPREWPDEWRLIGRAEIAATLHVSGQRAATVMARPDAPKPVAKLKLGRVWRDDLTRAYLAVPRVTGQPSYDIDMDRARELYVGQKLTVAQAAAELDVPRDVLHDRLAAAPDIELRTVDIHRPARRVGPDERARIIVALGEPGATPNSVAVAFGRSPMTVQRIQRGTEQQS